MSRRKSNELRELQGTLKNDRIYSPTANYPAATDDDITAPPYLGRYGKALFRKTAALMSEQGVLQRVDITLLSAYASAFDGFVNATLDLKKNGYVLTATAETRSGFSNKQYRNPSVDLQVKFSTLLASLGSRLGLDPISRQRVEASILEDKKKKSSNRSSEADIAERYNI